MGTPVRLARMTGKNAHLEGHFEFGRVLGRYNFFRFQTTMNYDDATNLGKTLAGVTKAEFGPPTARLTLVPVLSPIAGQVTERVPVVGDEFYLGRKEASHIYLRDATVSRVHARIVRCDDEYILKDLGSSLGTYVDNVPIINCVLRDGDMIQIGKNVFYFDRLLELRDPMTGKRS